MPPNSLVSIGIAVILCLIGLSQAERHKHHEDHPKHHEKGPYKLIDHYEPKHFFDKFKFYTEADPTYGFVQYVNRSYAKHNGLIRTFDHHVEIGVDNVNTYDPKGPGRPSVRLQSNKTYTHGLFILDLNRMPYACGAWPAFWTFGPKWPTHGEIDIIEGVNTNNYNLATLHTTKGCSVAGANQHGELVSSACDDNESKTGCSVLAKNKHRNNFGHGFNHIGGGVYAMEWTSSYIRTWHFPHHRVPEGIRHGNPDPHKFGVPQANFEGSCDFNKHFRDHTIVFDVTFCGQFAGAAYGQSNCPMASRGYDGCNAFVGYNPSNFTDVHWSVNDLKVYQLKGKEKTGYLTAPPTSYSSVVPLASTLVSSKLSLIQPPGGGASTRVPSHTLSVASTHKSNKPPKTTMTSSSHKPHKAHTTAKSSHVASHKATTTARPSKSSKSESELTSKSSSSTRSRATPTSTSKPTCDSRFETINDVVYHIYCDATLDEETLKKSDAPTFADCIRECDAFADCTGSVFTNSTIPSSCLLKHDSGRRQPEAAAPISPDRGVYVAYRLQDGAFRRPTTGTTSELPTTSYYSSSTMETTSKAHTITSRFSSTSASH